ncbi:DUF1010 domain-containing protein [Comamonas sp. SCN 65-56]
MISNSSLKPTRLQRAAYLIR